MAERLEALDVGGVIMIPWHNQACAKCGVTAELHRSDPDGYIGGPMLPSCDCREFVFSPELYELATPEIIKLSIRVARLEQAVFGK